ncbi:carboxynorspermidine decarboxylase [Oceaniferula spumae]|uniref:Carboxynorspermidine/carboxyspermidine decarboxylase n=1 Tax=Oceaniferula spumae TaxID=2979115 RepID=A0AAT9FKF7_9BACT
MSKDILTICARPSIPTPCHLLHRGLLANNLKILADVQERSSGNIILALKGFATHSTFPQIAKVLKGTTASSINEAKLGIEEFGGEIHTYCVAYKGSEVRWLSTRANHITFNSLSQWQRFQSIVTAEENKASYGLRINPEYSEVETEIYNPCRPGTRFGITADVLNEADLTGIEGLHFHSMCEQGADTLERTLEHVEKKFGRHLLNMKWLNMGGGHHITRPDYDTDLLVQLIKHMRNTYELEVYLEPGEAVALNTGFLVSTVLDRFNSNGHEVAILDTSASAHMPDVLEMPYRPEIIGAGEAGEKPHTITLGGLTCLAGDIIGDYSFDEDLKVGDRLVFTDMAHYSMVKNTTFNGVNLPSIANYDPASNRIDLVKEFTYESYRDRLS